MITRINEWADFQVVEMSFAIVANRAMLETLSMEYNNLLFNLCPNPRLSVGLLRMNPIVFGLLPYSSGLYQPLWI